MTSKEALENISHILEVVVLYGGISCTKRDIKEQLKLISDDLDELERLKSKVDVDMDIYDTEETHENCTVQIWSNSRTGKISIGWWKNDE